MEKFRNISINEYKKLTKQEKEEYRKALLIYLKGQREKIIGHHFRNAIHPMMLKQMTNMRTFELNPVGDSLDNKKIAEKTMTEGPVIFAVNHSNVHDVPTAGEIIENHCYLLASDEVRGSFNGLLFELMGVIWVTRDPRKKAKTELSPKEHMYKLIEEGKTLKTFPEGTWNVSDNLIILPFRWGDVAISQKTQRPIIPLILDYDYTENTCYYNIGKPIYIRQNDNLQEVNEELRDEMATLRYEIWEEKEAKRKMSPGYLTGQEYTEYARSEFLAYKEKLKEEYPNFDEEEQANNIFYPYTRKEEVFEHMKILTPSRKNAFLYGKNKNY